MMSHNELLPHIKANNYVFPPPRANDRVIPPADRLIRKTFIIKEIL